MDNELMQHTRLLVRIIIVCLVLAGATLVIKNSEQLRQTLPTPLQLFFAHLDNVFPYSWHDPEEHTLDHFVEGAEGTEETASTPEGEAEPIPAEEENPEIPKTYDDNPRYTIELHPELGEVLRSEVLTGDTAGKILGEWLDANSLASLLDAAKDVYPLTKIRTGQPFALIRDPESKALRGFKYEVDKEEYLLVERTGEQYTARLERIDYVTKLTRIQGHISTSLSEAVVDMKEEIGLAIALANIFASEINFITDLRVDDQFEVLVEKRYRHDEFKGYGRVLGARFTNQGQTHVAYLFHNPQGRFTYYDAKGENLHRALLKAPLSFLRVTSRYTMARRHPVFGTVRPHQGIDYGAPKGTPIMAVGDGVVTLAGYNGGYGKQVILRHANGLESLYGHMSGYAKGITKGKKVRQGQTIGFVGATGTATGPHLDFRIRQRGAFVNPDKLVVPRDKGIDSRNKKAFQATVDAVNAYWNGQDLSLYDPDKWFAEDAAS